jgi:hypothetical protein
MYHFSACIFLPTNRPVVGRRKEHILESPLQASVKAEKYRQKNEEDRV